MALLQAEVCLPKAWLVRCRLSQLLFVCLQVRFKFLDAVTDRLWRDNQTPNLMCNNQHTLILLRKCVCVSLCSGPKVLSRSIFANSLSFLALLNRTISSRLVPARGTNQYLMCKPSQCCIPLSISLWIWRNTCSSLILCDSKIGRSLSYCNKTLPNRSTSTRAHLSSWDNSAFTREPPLEIWCSACIFLTNIIKFASCGGEQMTVSETRNEDLYATYRAQLILCM